MVIPETGQEDLRGLAYALRAGHGAVFAAGGTRAAAEIGISPPASRQPD